jgi:hypothetical protein
MGERGMWMVDTLLGWMPWYRRSRGGRWEYVVEVWAGEWWRRVDLFSPSSVVHDVSVVKREDWRR